jgi:WXG100 family type VII secretion target
MADQAVSTTLEGMQSVGQEFVSTAQGFTGYLRSVNTEIAALQSTWTGQAALNFGQAMDTWETAFQSIINDLLHMADVMGVNTQAYHGQETDAANAAQSFGSFFSHLPGV